MRPGGEQEQHADGEGDGGEGVLSGSVVGAECGLVPVGEWSVAGLGGLPVGSEVEAHAWGEDEELEAERDEGDAEGEQAEHAAQAGGAEVAPDGPGGEGDDDDQGAGELEGVVDREDAIGGAAGGDHPVVAGVFGEGGKLGVEALHRGEEDGGGDSGHEERAEPDAQRGDVERVNDGPGAWHARMVLMGPPRASGGAYEWR